MFTLGLVFLSFGMSNLFGQIPNHSFEFWETIPYYENVEPYATSNFGSYVNTGVPNITQVPGVTGSAVRMETVQGVLGDTLIGSLVSGNIFTQNFEGGSPYNDTPDSIGGYFRYDIPAGDSALIFVIFNNDLVSFQVAVGGGTIGGVQPDFTYISFPISEFSLAPDSVSVLITSGNIFNAPAPGGWIEIDDLKFINVDDQLPNCNFEEWNEVADEKPFNWSAANILPVLLGQAPPMTKTSDASDGNFALRLETVQTTFFASIDTLGIFSTGVFNPASGDFEGGNVAFLSNSDNIEFNFQYKYLPVSDNVGLVNLLFTDSLENEILDTIYEIPPATEYTTINYGVNLPVEADFVQITFASSDYREESYFVEVGDVLFVDALGFAVTVNTDDLIFSDILKTYPNPVNDLLTINTGGISSVLNYITFYDLNGRAVLRKRVGATTSKLQLDVSSLSSGMYFYVLMTEEGEYSGKVIKE